MFVHRRRGRGLFVEFKRQGGRLRPARIVGDRWYPGQRDWLLGLDACGFEVYLFEPSDLELARRVLFDGPLPAAERRARLEALPDPPPVIRRRRPR